MVEIEADAFSVALRVLADLHRLTEAQDEFSYEATEIVAGIVETLSARMGLVVTPIEAKGLAACVEIREPEEYIRSHAGHLSSTFMRELKGHKFLYVTPDKSKFFELAPDDIFGEQVLVSFASFAVDLEEASKAYAFDRPTACVFHLMRVMERTSSFVIQSLPKPRPSARGQPGWGTNRRVLADYLENKVKSPRPKYWLNREPFYTEVLTDWNGMYKTWRCNTVHDLDQVYSSERAKWILEAVTSTLGHAAKHVNEMGRWVASI